MRRVLRTFGAGVAVLALAAGVMAAQTTSKTATAKSAAKSTATRSARAMSATGTITRYDASTKTLTLTTAKGDQRFTLDSAARVNQGSKKITADDLNTLTGQHAKVRYSEAGGTMTAHSVMVSGAMASGHGKGKKTEKPAKS
jgi:uncharacterized protein YjdB